MKARALRYLAVFSLPILGFIAIKSEGWLCFLPLIEAFFMIPLLELAAKPQMKNLSEHEEKAAQAAQKRAEQLRKQEEADKHRKNVEKKAAERKPQVEDLPTPKPSDIPR